jgi:hypothetical protein
MAAGGLGSLALRKPPLGERPAYPVLKTLLASPESEAAALITGDSATAPSESLLLSATESKQFVRSVVHFCGDPHAFHGLADRVP